MLPTWEIPIKAHILEARVTRSVKYGEMLSPQWTPLTLYPSVSILSLPDRPQATHSNAKAEKAKKKN